MDRPRPARRSDRASRRGARQRTARPRRAADAAPPSPQPPKPRQAGAPASAADHQTAAPAAAAEARQAPRPQRLHSGHRRRQSRSGRHIPASPPTPRNSWRAANRRGREGSPDRLAQSVEKPASTRRYRGGQIPPRDIHAGSRRAQHPRSARSRDPFPQRSSHQKDFGYEPACTSIGI